MKFEWDPAKEVINEAKHDISFFDAMDVFDDPHHLEEDSTRPEHGEDRMKAIGMVGDVLMVVIYTDRLDRRRIISARKVSKNERKRYHHSRATS